MKKLLLTAIAATALTCICSNAWAGAYFGVRGGYENYKAKDKSVSLDEGDADYVVGGFVGYHYSFFRLEGEYMYHPERSFVGGGYEVYTHTAMGNVFFAPPVRSLLHPYLMGGAGVAFHTAKLNGTKDDNTSFAWQVGAGVELELSNSVFLDCGARYTDWGKAEVKNSEADIKSYLYYLGLRFEY